MRQVPRRCERQRCVWLQLERNVGMKWGWLIAVVDCGTRFDLQYTVSKEFVRDEFGQYCSVIG